MQQSFSPIPINEDRRVSLSTEARIKQRKENESVPKVMVNPLASLSKEEIENFALLGAKSFIKITNVISNSSNFSLMIDNLEKKDVKTKYVDPEFPPSIKSLAVENIGNRSQWKSFVWLRPEDFIKGDYILMDLENNNFKPKIHQGLGALEDTYFLSSLASVAEYPELIRNCFILKVDTKNEPETLQFCKDKGVYCVKLSDSGIPKEIVVDDYFPCISPVEGQAFAKGVKGQIWVSILEKAWAKLYGSYYNIEVGFTREVLHALTNAPTRMVYSDKPYLWDYLMKATQNKWVMATATLESLDESFGIIPSHCYSMIGAYAVKYQGKQVNLVKLRSPLAKCNYEGKWNENDAEWEKVSKDDKERIGSINENEGYFCMEFDDYKSTFQGCEFALVSPNNKYTYLTEKLSHVQGDYFGIDIQEKGVYYFSANQTSLRHLPKNVSKNKKYAQVTMVLGKKLANGKYKYIGGKQLKYREVWVYQNLDKINMEEEIDQGEYVLYVKVLFKDNVELPITISVYGPKSAIIYRLIREEYKDFLENVYLDYAKNPKYRVKYDSLENEGAPNSEIAVVPFTRDGYGFVVVQNHENYSFKCSLRFKKLNVIGARLKRTYGGSSTAEFVLKPGQERLVLVRISDKTKCKDNVFGLSKTLTKLKEY